MRHIIHYKVCRSHNPLNDEFTEKYSLESISDFEDFELGESHNFVQMLVKFYSLEAKHAVIMVDSPKNDIYVYGEYITMQYYADRLYNKNNEGLFDLIYIILT